MIRVTWGLVALLAVVFAPARVLAQSVEVHSPDGRLAVTVRVNGEGRPEYSVRRGDHLLIDWSRLGFILADAPKLERNFQLAAQPQKSFDDTWEQPWGEKRYVRNHGNELRVGLREKTGERRELGVVFRVFDEGVGFRYEFPAQPKLAQVNIVEELTEFAIADAADAWWIPGGEWNRYEYLYQKSPLSEVGQAHTPITLRTRGEGVHMAIHEAALVDYSALWLRRVSGQRLKAELSPASSGPKVSRAAPFSTPWRAILIADSAAKLYEASDLFLNLNEPNKLGDVSWVKPFKYVGIWWEMHLGTKTWGSGAQHGATTANTKRYIDFAAKHGFRGVLVEGWNRGWDGDWFADGRDFDFTKAYPDFDIEALAKYGRVEGRTTHRSPRDGGQHRQLRKAIGARFGFVPAAWHRLGEDRLCGRRRRRSGAGCGWQDPFRMARRPGAVAPPSARGRRGGETTHQHRCARTHQGHGAAPHVSQLGVSAKARGAWSTTPGATR